MKMTKKKVFVSALAVCMIAMLSVGTLAWFNATESVTNTFKVADSDGDGAPDFSVEVWETSNEDLDKDGILDDKTYLGNTYANILPGDVIAKNPTVENTGDYDQWIRVKVTFDEYTKIKAACEKHGISADLRNWLDVDTTVWTEGTETVVEGDTITYTYYFNYRLAKDETAVLFNKVMIPGAFVQEDMAFVNGNFTITVKAEAIQADNTGDSAVEAFKNFWQY